MTIKSVNDPDFMHWQVRDLDTGKLVERVQWADDSLGWVIVRTRTDRGVVRRLVWGNFRLEDKREQKVEAPNHYDPDVLMDALAAAEETVRQLKAIIEARNVQAEMFRVMYETLGQKINKAFMDGFTETRSRR